MREKCENYAWIPNRTIAGWVCQISHRHWCSATMAHLEMRNCGHSTCQWVPICRWAYSTLPQCDPWNCTNECSARMLRPNGPVDPNCSRANVVTVNDRQFMEIRIEIMVRFIARDTVHFRMWNSIRTRWFWSFVGKHFDCIVYSARADRIWALRVDTSNQYFVCTQFFHRASHWHAYRTIFLIRHPNNRFLFHLLHQIEYDRATNMAQWDRRWADTLPLCTSKNENKS